MSSQSTYASVQFFKTTSVSGLSDIGVEGRVAHKGGGLYDWHLLVDVNLTVSHLFFVASLCFMMGYGSWVHADETTHLGASTEAVSDGDDEGVVDKLLSRFGEGSATWSLGVGLAAGVYPHYPGSKQDETAVAPFPYAEYHSDRIELDRDGLAAKLFQSDRFKLDLSVNGALPVSAKNNDLAPSANRDSPLLGQDSYLAGGVAAIWMFKSK